MRTDVCSEGLFRPGGRRAGLAFREMLCCLAVMQPTGPQDVRSMACDKQQSESGDVADGAVIGASRGRRLPPWLKRPRPDDLMVGTRAAVDASGVATVCREARCPNLTECWSHRTATFMILGDTCTRNCAFCAVNKGRPLPPQPDEPVRLAEAAAKLGLKHVVITSVSRDDLPDEGAGHFAACVREVRARLPESTIEVLPSDFHVRARVRVCPVQCPAGRLQPQHRNRRAIDAADPFEGRLSTVTASDPDG